MTPTLVHCIYYAGWLQLSILVASSLVPVRLNWRESLAGLPRLHRQLYWVYGGYVVLSIVALGTISLLCAGELAQGSLLARAFCAYAALFWGIRLALQGVLDVREFLTAWWLKAGYYGLTVVFASLTAIFGFAAAQPW